jgi:phenylalanyl-tRNA synthetase alpha subunit
VIITHSDRHYEDGFQIKDEEAERKKLALRRQRSAVDEHAEEVKEIEESR